MKYPKNRGQLFNTKAFSVSIKVRAVSFMTGDKDSFQINQRL